MQSRIIALVRWLHARRKRLNVWAVRVVSFYFGYRILNQQIYVAKTADPLLIFLGLWLCGVAPASFFDGIRKVTDVTHGGEATAGGAGVEVAEGRVAEKALSVEPQSEDKED